MARICSRDAGSGVFKTFYSKEKSRHFKYSSQMRILQEGLSDGWRIKFGRLDVIIDWLFWSVDGDG